MPNKEWLQSTFYFYHQGRRNWVGFKGVVLGVLVARAPQFLTIYKMEQK